MNERDNFFMLVIVLVLFILCWTAQAFTQVITDEPLKATISLDKDRFLVNEAIWLTFIIENVSKDKILEASADPLTGKVRIEVVTYEGDTLYGGCIIGNAVGTPPTLDPKEKDIYFVDLVGSICNYGIKHEDALHYRLIPEGDYYVQATVRYRYQEKITPVLTNKLDFKVEKPKGREKKAYDLLVKGRKKCYPEKKRKEGREMIWRMIQEYPNSVYRDAAYELLVDKFHHDSELALAFIEKYPNSGLIGSVIFAVTRKIDKPTERKKFFEDIIKKHPNTKAAMYAENRLDKWRRGKIWVDEPIPKD